MKNKNIISIYPRCGKCGIIMECAYIDITDSNVITATYECSECGTRVKLDLLIKTGGENNAV